MADRRSCEEQIQEVERTCGWVVVATAIVFWLAGLLAGWVTWHG